MLPVQAAHFPVSTPPVELDPSLTLMRLSTVRVAAASAATVAFLSCAEAPTAPPRAASVGTLVQASSVARPQVVISQIYGGGGNTGAPFTNDFVELFNPGSTPVVMTNWSVQYASSVGSNWSRANVSGTIQPGGYFLVSLAGGATGVALPTPDVVGGTGVNLSGTTGKIVLVSNASTILAGTTCPTSDVGVVDRVAYGTGTGTGSCVTEWGGRAPAPSNSTSISRKEGGCAFTGSATADFQAGAPAPRNSASPAITPCAGGPTGPTVVSVTLSATTASLFVGDTLRLLATPRDSAGDPLAVSVSWSSSPSSTASVSSTGLVTALAAGGATITASAGGQSATATVTVSAAPRVVSPIQVQINELMGDPANAQDSSWGEWFEVRNTGDTDVNLQGWRILSGGSNQPAHTINASVIVPAGGYAVLGRGFDPARNGGITLDYNYFVGTSSTLWLNNRNDYLVLLDTAQALVDSVSWDSLPRGVTMGLRPGQAPVTSVNSAAWGYSTTTFGDGDYGTPRAENTDLADVPPFVSPNRITLSGRTAADTLPIGFEAQVFARLIAPNGDSIPSTRTWSSLTPDVISVDEDGVVRGVGTGTGIVRVVMGDGSGRNLRLTVKEFLPSSLTYANPAEFGLPVDDDASDDFVLNRREYTSSWNGARGIPNWVAFNLVNGHRVPGADRCDCFTFDPQIEQAGFSRYTTADYAGAGAAWTTKVGAPNPPGIGIDRGHLVRSSDRTAGQLDNARTFYFSNIIPQFSDNNQGPWAQHELYLSGLTETQGKELFVFAGASGSLGTVKDEGLITIPAWTWKVSVIAAPGTRLEDVRDYRDLEVLAVVMPNASGIRNVNWQTSYVVTADSVERLSGYRFLTALPAKTRRALITNTKPPLGSIAAVSGLEGAPITFDASGSVDPNGSIVSYAWDFGDGNVGSGVSPTHTFDFFGSYTVQLVTTDNDGLVDTVSTTVEVAQVTPAQGIAQLRAALQQFAAAVGLNRGQSQSLLVKVNAAEASIARGSVEAALGQLGALRNELQALVNSGRAAEHQTEVIELAVERVERATK